MRAVQEALEAFRARGYAIVPGVIPRPVIDELRDFLSEAADRSIALLRGELNADGAHLPDAIDRFVRAGGVANAGRELQDALAGQFALQERLSERLWEVPRQAAVSAVLKHALNTEALAMHMPPMARYVLPGNVHAGVPPHRDISYNRHMSEFVTMWVPLVDIDDQCGGVCIFEEAGARPEDEDPHQVTGNLWLTAVSTEKARPRSFTMSPGDVLIFRPDVLHGSMPNTSDRMRLSIDYRFFSADRPSTKHVLDLQTWQVRAPA